MLQSQHRIARASAPILTALLVTALLGAAATTPAPAQQRLGGSSSKPPAPAEPKAPSAEPDASLVRPGPPPNLSLMYTGDVIGYLEPCG